MHDVNNDMDELFRQAGEHYPLRTDSDDWDKVLQGLQQDDIPVPVSTNPKGKRRQKSTWLLLLLPLALLYIIPYNHSGKRKEPASHLAQTGFKKTTDSSEVNAITNHTSDHQKTKRTEDKSQLVKSHKTQALAIDHTLSNKNQTTIINRKKDKQTAENAYQNPHSFSARMPQKKIAFIQSTKESQASAYHNGFDKQPITEADKKRETAKQPAQSSSRIETADSINNGSAITMNKAQSDSNQIEESKKDSSAAVNKAADKKATTKIKAKLKPQKGFYTGVMASLDLSTIKLQKISKAGYSFNVLLGYRFSKHISVETGINWTSKQYYSDGKYFDKSRTDIPVASEIISTNGTCNMFEIPVVAKYDFAYGAKSHFFITAGLSSYLMKEENYAYYAEHNGNYYNAKKSYKNSGNNWFSVASISAGYQLYINKHISLRIEPYIKMPLTGIGIAKLPITSTGISAGFVRSF